MGAKESMAEAGDYVDRMLKAGFKCYFMAEEQLPQQLPSFLQLKAHFKKGELHYFEVTPQEYRAKGVYVGEFELDGLRMTRHLIAPDYFAS